MKAESEMMDDLQRAFEELNDIEFVEEYNRIMGTDFTYEEILWE